MSDYGNGFQNMSDYGTELQQRKEEKFNLALLIACLVGAVIGWFLAELIYAALPDDMPAVLQVGIYFLVVALGIVLVAFISELLVRHIKSVWTGSELGRSILILLVFLVGMFLAGMLFQFLYGLGYSRKTLTNLDDYLIVIDNSSSTNSTDPDDERFTAIVDLAASLDATKKLSVVVFDNTIVGTFELQEMTDEAKEALAAFMEEMKTKSKGGTQLQAALEEAINNYTPVAGRNAAVILLSDGESSINYSTISDLYAQKEVPIYCVAFSHMGYAGTNTMTRLAETTDGYYCEISELSTLQTALEQMMTLTSRRSLLERRRGTDVHNVLPMILRILFVTLLGLPLAPVLALVLDCDDLMHRGFLIHIPFCLIAGLLMEFLIRLLGGGLTRLLMAILYAIMISVYMKITFIIPTPDPFGGDPWSGGSTLTPMKGGKSSHLKGKRNVPPSDTNSFY
ncbi:MAG: VWA domain-containing protein [Lachnospiraceae bacterium]|nr:VWA domain-containing protein [Lachnospiraceae bacterium]